MPQLMEQLFEEVALLAKASFWQLLQNLLSWGPGGEENMKHRQWVAPALGSRPARGWSFYF